MNSRRTLRWNNSVAAAPAGTRYWASEFERIHLMTAARLRGEPVFRRRQTSF